MHELNIEVWKATWNVPYPGRDGVFGRTRLELVTSDNPLGLDMG